MMDIRKLYEKYKGVVLYLFFGVCTTIVNIVAYWLCAHILSLDTMISTVIAWILAVLFAYITNRKWVFRSDARTGQELIREIVSFFGCRLATGIVDWACMFIFVELLNWDDMVVKFASNVLVVILNYIASKLFIFRKREKSEN